MSKTLCIFGEVLFDVFPGDHRVLGGAPFNVAWHLQAFSQTPLFISCVGNDPDGTHIRKTMTDWGMNTHALQTEKQLSTGKVIVTLEKGEPSYDITEPAAYDAIQAPTDLTLACDFLYHGSLALRNKTSMQTLKQLKACQPETIFVDVNLRAPWWNKSVVLEQILEANWVKLNVDEFNLLYVSDKTGNNRLSSFIDEYQLQGIVLTNGKAGAEIFTSNQQHYTVKPDIEVEVIDTVGAGDAFSSIIILGFKNNWPLQTTLQRAQDFSSAIVSQRGATVSNKSFYKHFINKWNID